MHNPWTSMRRLHVRGPQSRGLTVDAEGVVLGPDCALVQRTRDGYRSVTEAKLARLNRVVFDNDRRLDRLPLVLASIVEALRRGDLVKAQLLGLEIPIDELDDVRLGRLAAAVTLMKASPDDPKHPGWPADTPDGFGGKFRPENGMTTAPTDSLPAMPESTAPGASKLPTTAAEKAIEAIKRNSIRGMVRDRLVKLFGVVAVEAVPFVDLVADIWMLVDLVKDVVKRARLGKEAEMALAFIKDGPHTLQELRVSDKGESFPSFDAFKKETPIGRSIEEYLVKRFGPAGDGYEYHHIVEQGGANAGTFPRERLHSTENIVRVPRLLHEAITAEYAQPAQEAPTLSLRQWLRTQSYDTQYAEGLRVMRKLGIVK